MKNNFLKKLLIAFFITVTGAFARKNINITLMRIQEKF